MNLRDSSPKDMAGQKRHKKSGQDFLDRSTHAHSVMGFTRALLDFPNIANKSEKQKGK